MRVLVEREKVRFVSGDTECVAWHYPGTNGACVIMAGGLAVTKEPGTDLFAKRFHDAGFAVLAFDYRRIGESGGQPRQVLPIRDQLADWQAAIAFARTLPGVDPARIAVWAFSASGGHVLRVAARNPELAAVIAQTPYVGGLAATGNAVLPGTMLIFLALGLAPVVPLRPDRARASATPSTRNDAAAASRPCHDLRQAPPPRLGAGLRQHSLLLLAAEDEPAHRLGSGTS